MGLLEDFWKSYLERSYAPGYGPNAPAQQQQQGTTTAPQPVRTTPQPAPAPAQQEGSEGTVFNPTESMTTYPFYQVMHGAAEWWGSNVMPLVEQYLDWSKPVLGGVTRGIAQLPGGIAETAGMAVPGTERMVREAIRDPIAAGGIVTAGVPWYASQMIQEARSHPQEFAGQVIGSMLLAAGAGAISTKIGGFIRTRGMTEIPIERIGYAPEVGFPVSYRQTPDTLIRSFETGSLIPRPDRMSLAERVPYVPEMARLPGEGIGKPVLWTAWDTTPIGRGRQFVLTEPGSSEIPGMYGAPIAESYFTKVGGQMPRIIGTDIQLIKAPSIFHTEVQSLEAISRSVRAGGFESINRYISQVEAGGKAYLPMLKPEYEAVVPMGSVLDILPRQYFTKLGGIGEKHFLGTRVPIIEARTTGVIMKGPAVENALPSLPYESYRPGPILNVPYGIPGSAMATIERFRIQISSGTVESSVRTSAVKAIEGYGNTLSSIYSKSSVPYSPSVPQVYTSSVRGPSSISMPPSSSVAPSRVTPPSYPSTPSRVYVPSYPSVPGGPSYPSPPSVPSVPYVPYSPPYAPPTVPYTPPVTLPYFTRAASFPIWWDRKTFRYKESLRVNIQEWWITNPVPSMESIFGRIGGISLPRFTMPSFSW